MNPGYSSHEFVIEPRGGYSLEESAGLCPTNLAPSAHSIRGGPPNELGTLRRVANLHSRGRPE
jgi:hypothetical protein